MKKAILFFILLSMLFVSELEAARLFEYRGSFSAKRSSDEKVSNYVLLKQGSNVEFALSNKANSNVKAVVSKISLTSDPQISIESRKGIEAFMVPESGIYEVTIIPSTDKAEDIDFLLSIYEGNNGNASVPKQEITKDREQGWQEIAKEQEQEQKKGHEEEHKNKQEELAQEQDTKSIQEQVQNDVQVSQEDESTLSDDDLLYAGQNNLDQNADIVNLIKPISDLSPDAKFTLENSYSVLENTEDKLSAWPHSVQWTNDGCVWVLDSQRRRLLRLGQNGNIIGAYGSKGIINGALGLPSALTAIDSKLYVSDYSNHAVHIYNLSGNWIKSIVSDKKSGLRLTFPGGICIRHEEMWIPDKGNSGILCFDLNGNFLGTFESTKEAPIDSPICVRANDKFLYIMQDDGKLKIFNPMGSIERIIDTQSGEMLGFDADPWGTFWVCDGNLAVVKRFSFDGKLLATIKSPETLEEPWLPTSVAVRADGYVAVTDANNKMIHVFKSN